MVGGYVEGKEETLADLEEEIWEEYRKVVGLP